MTKTKTGMTLQELVKELKKIKKEQTHDLESDHSDADDLLLKYINHRAVTKAFNDIEKWYA